MRKIFILLGVTMTTACFFDFDRGQDLQPGDVAGRAVLINGEPAAFARVVVDGSPRVVRAASDGRFVIRGLSTGSWSFRVEFDEDGDGWVEQGAREVVLLREVGGETVALELGDVQLEGPARLAGEVALPDGVAGFVSVGVARILDDGDFDVLSVDTSLEQRVTAGVDGTYSFPALLAGEAIVYATLAVDDDVYSSEGVRVTLLGGELTELPPLVLTLVPDGTTLPARFRFESPLEDGETAEVTVRAQRPQRDPLVLTFGDGDQFTTDIEPGEVELFVTTSAGRQGVDGLKVVPLALSTEGLELDWLVELSVFDEEDRDGDGVQGLPQRLGVDDPLWADCAAQCATGADLNIGAVEQARCESGGEVYDCEDDGDGQTDTTEPACLGLGLGGDRDGDGICDPTDPNPYCFANDDTCSPDDVTGQYGGDGELPPPDDAGVPDDDAGVPGEDAGVPGNDAGPIPQAPAIVREILNDAFSAPGAITIGQLDGATDRVLMAGEFNSDGQLVVDEVPCLNVDTAPTTRTFWVASFSPFGNCQEIFFPSAAGRLVGRPAVVTSGETILVALIVEGAITLGQDAGGAAVTDDDSALRLVVARYDHRARVVGNGSVPVADLAGANNIFVNLIVADSDDGPLVALRAPNGDLSVGSPQLVGLAPGVDATALVRFTAAFALDTAVTAADGEPLEGLFTLGGGRAAVVVRANTVAGQDVSNTRRIEVLDNNLTPQEITIARGARTVNVVDEGSEVRALIGVTRPETGVFALVEAFQNDRNFGEVRTDDEADRRFFGPFGLANHNQTALAFDPLDRVFYAATTAGISISVSNDFGSVQERAIITNTGLVTEIALDATTRDLFYLDEEGLVFACPLDNCNGTTAVNIIDSCTDIAVSPIEERVYCATGAAVDRVGYDGANLETNFIADAATTITIDPLNDTVIMHSNSSGLITLATTSGGAASAVSGFAADDVSDIEYDPTRLLIFLSRVGQLDSIRIDGVNLSSQTVNRLRGLGPILSLPPSVDDTSFSDGAIASAILVDGAADVPVDFVTPDPGARLELTSSSFGVNGLVVSGRVFGAATLPGGARLVNDGAFGRDEVFVAGLSDSAARFALLTDGGGFGQAIVGSAPGLNVAALTSFDGLYAGRVPFAGGFGFWRFGPDGDGFAIDPVRPTLGGAAPGDLVPSSNVRSERLELLAHGEGGYLVSANDLVSPYIDRGGPGADAWNRSFDPASSIASIATSPLGTIAVGLSFPDSFTFGAATATVNADEDGAVILVFDKDGVKLGHSFFAFPEGAPGLVEVDVNDRGRVAAAFTADGVVRGDIDLNNQTLTTAGQEAVFATLSLNKGKGNARLDFFGSAGFVGAGLSAAINQFNSAIFSADGSPIGTPPADSIISLIRVRDGVRDATTPTLGFTAPPTILTDLDISPVTDTVVVAARVVGSDAGPFFLLQDACTSNSIFLGLVDRVHTFVLDDNNCFAQNVPIDAPTLSQPIVRFADANNVVVAGTYSGALNTNAPDGTVVNVSDGGEIYIANLEVNGFQLQLRAIHAGNFDVAMSLSTISAYSQGQILVDMQAAGAGSVDFSDGTTVDFSADGVLWHLFPTTDLDNVVFFE